MAQQSVAKRELSLGELFKDLAEETSTLVRHEVALAQAEVTEKAVRAGRDVGRLAVGGVIAYAGLLALVAAAIMGLGIVLPLWLAALIVGVVVGGIGSLFAGSALADLRRTDPMPRETIETIKEDVQWLKKEIG